MSLPRPLQEAVNLEYSRLEKTAGPGRFLKGFFSKGFKSVPKKVQKGLETEAKEMASGPESFLAFLPQMGLEKLIGKEKVRGAVWRGLSQPAQSVNISAGRQAQKLPGMKWLFTEKRKLPTGVTRKGSRKFEEMEYPSATAPLQKGMALATPVIVGSSIDDWLRGQDKRKLRGTGERGQKRTFEKSRTENASTPYGVQDA